MKNLILIFFIFINISELSIAQKYFSSITTPPEMLSSFGVNFDMKEDTIFLLNHGILDQQDSLIAKSVLNKYKIDGTLLSTWELPGYDPKAQLLLQNNTIFVVGLFEYPDSLQIVAFSNSGKQKIHSFPNPLKYYDGLKYSIVKFDNKYVITLSAIFNLFTWNSKFYSYLYWLNEDLSLDTIMKVDLPYSSLHTATVDNEGFLNILNSHHNDDFNPNKYQIRKDYLGYFKVNINKEITHKFHYEAGGLQYSFPDRIYGIIKDDGVKYFLGNRFDSYQIVYALGKNDSLIWTNKASYAHEKLEQREYAICKNGDVIIVGRYGASFSDISQSAGLAPGAYIQRISPEGKTKFVRQYGYFSAESGNSLGNFLYDIKETPQSGIVAIGGISNLKPHATHDIGNDSTWLVHVDSLGCIGHNMCNDDIVWNAPKDLFQYDQLNMRHKTWHYSQTDGHGEIKNLTITCGLDTTMFDNVNGWNRFRPLLSEDMNTGIEKVDSFLLTWTKEGRVYGMKPIACTRCRYPILFYDFSLNEGDTFPLPIEYGNAIVTKVDSVTLYPGYTRKRLILKHQNTTNQANYGDLIWIEGIGATNGLLYFRDWENNTNTQLSCYYDRGEKRYSTTNDPNCQKVVSLVPTFNDFGPYCINSFGDDLPSISNNGILGTWSPAMINTSEVGMYTYTFLPLPGQNADTFNLLIQILPKISPLFNQLGPYEQNQSATTLPSSSINGISGTWSPISINTSALGITTYNFTPNEGQCSENISIGIEVLASIDTTDMPGTAAWYSTTWLGDGINGENCDLGINIIQVKRDTLIDNRLCRILGVTDAGIYIKESEIPFYTKNNKMYFYEDNKWKLLYNFAANIGDTVTYYVSAKAIYYSLYGTIPFPIETGPFRLIVDNIDTVYTTDGKPLKRFYINWFEFSNNNMGEIVESAGSIHKLFGNNVIIVTPECLQGPLLRCYIHNDYMYKFEDKDCDSIDALDEDNLTLPSISPNPAQDHINITLSHGMTLPLRYEVKTTSGHRVEVGTHSSTDVLSLDVDDFASGMYFVRIMDKHGKIWAGKWVRL